jgi:DNA modification methylase
MEKVNTILQGDVIERLKDIEDNTIQCVVTSPPYWGLRDYGTATWIGGDKDCNHFRDNHVSNSCTTGHNNSQKSGGVADSIYKSVCKKCGAIREDEQLGLEETPEEYVENMVKVFREVRKVLKDDGTLWLNLGDSYSSGGRSTTTNQTLRGNNNYGVTRPKPSENIKPKDLIGIPWRVAFALQQDGWYLRQDIIWHKPNPMPESVTDRCTKSHEYIFLLTKSANYYYDAESIKEKTLTYDNTNRDRDTTRLNNTPGRTRMAGLKTNNYEKRNKRSVWKINTKPYKDAHFAVFPEKLPELCIKAGSKKGDIVLDPFFGSGTTGFVAQRLYRRWLGIELNPEYIKIANKRFVQQELFV